MSYLSELYAVLIFCIFLIYKIVKTVKDCHKDSFLKKIWIGFILMLLSLTPTYLLFIQPVVKNIQQKDANKNITYEITDEDYVNYVQMVTGLNVLLVKEGISTEEQARQETLKSIKEFILTTGYKKANMEYLPIYFHNEIYNVINKHKEKIDEMKKSEIDLYNSTVKNLLN